MYSEFLGENYHDTIRKILRATPELVTDSMVDAPANIGAMKSLITAPLEKMMHKGWKVDDERKFALLQKAAHYYLAGILCLPLVGRGKRLKSRSDWDKKRKRCIEKGNKALVQLNWLLEAEKKEASM